MKKPTLIVALFLFATLGYAQVEHRYAYMLLVLDPQGHTGQVLVPDGSRPKELKVYRSFTQKSSLWILNELFNEDSEGIGFRISTVDGASIESGYVNRTASNQKIFLLEKAIRTNEKTIQEAMKAFEAKFTTIAEEKAKTASEQLRIQLLDALKDAKLFEDQYRKAVIDAAVNKFREEMKSTTENLKTELRKELSK